MTNPVTMNLVIKDDNNKSYKINFTVENKNLMKDLFPNFNKKNSLTRKEYQFLARIAGNSGEPNVLEESDVKGIRNLRNAIEKGNATWESGATHRLGGGSPKGDIYVNNVPIETTLKDVKVWYNLPDGSLQNYCDKAYNYGGNYDTLRVESGEVWFSIKTFAESNGMTIQEVIDMFPEKSAFSAIF